MIQRLLQEVKEYKKASLLAPALMVGEVVIFSSGLRVAERKICGVRFGRVCEEFAESDVRKYPEILICQY